MSYNFISDFWKINLLGKAIRFNSDVIIKNDQQEEVVILPTDCLYIYDFENEKELVKPKPYGFLKASYIPDWAEQEMIVDIKIPCELVKGYEVLETQEVLEFINKIKAKYYESNSLLVGQNLKIIESENAIDQKFMVSDFDGVKSTLDLTNEYHEKYHEILDQFKLASDKLKSMLTLEQRIMEALIVKKAFQKRYFDEDYAFSVGLKEKPRDLCSKNHEAFTMNILDHLVVMEPFVSHKLDTFINEQITFSAVVEKFIEKVKVYAGKPNWFPSNFIGLFSSLYFKNQYAYIYSCGSCFGYIVFESETMSSLPKHKPIVSNSALYRISLNTEAYVQNFSRLVDSYEGYQVSNLVHFLIVLGHVANKDYRSIVKGLKLFQMVGALGAVPELSGRLDLGAKKGPHKAIVALKQMALLRDRYGILDYIKANSGRNKLYSTNAGNHVYIALSASIATLAEDAVEGEIKHIEGFGNMLSVELPYKNKRVDLKLPLEFIDQSEQKLFRSLCLPIVEGRDGLYLHPLYQSYQYLAQDVSNYNLFFKAKGIIDEGNSHHQNFIQTLKAYLSETQAVDMDKPKGREQFEKIWIALLNKYGFSRLQMYRPNSTSLKIWDEVVGDVQMLLDVHGKLLHKTKELCVQNSVQPIALFLNREENSYRLLAESRTKDDRIYQSDWVDQYHVDFDEGVLRFDGQTFEQPASYDRIYEWTDHRVLNADLPVYFKNKERKSKFLTMLGIESGWVMSLENEQPFELALFRKLFNRVDRCVEYCLATSEFDQSVLLVKPYEMFEKAGEVYVKAKVLTDFAVLLYLKAPDQNGRDDIVQLFHSYEFAKNQNTAMQKTIEMVCRAESMSSYPDEMAKNRPVALIPELRDIPLAKTFVDPKTMVSDVTVKMSTDYIGLEANNFVLLQHLEKYNFALKTT